MKVKKKYLCKKTNTINTATKFDEDRTQLKWFSKFLGCTAGAVHANETIEKRVADGTLVEIK